MKNDNYFPNKIVILGMDHHNALGVARQFYLAGIKADGIIVCGGKQPVIKYSKYWGNITLVKDEVEGIEQLLKLYGSESRKPILITCTDKFAKEVDKQLNVLNTKFICPGVPQQGKLQIMMNKLWQYNFAVENNIRVVPSVVIEFLHYEPGCIISELKEKNVEKPFIVKPLISADGDKCDISICKDERDLINTLSTFKNKKYGKVLVQHQLDFDYEMLVVGACFPHKEQNKFILLKIIRSYPVGRGTGCFRKFILDKGYNDEIDKIISLLRTTGYRGLIDIELFNKDGKIYLNEFNLRSSGSSFAGNSQQFLYAYDYAKDCIGESVFIEEPYEIPKNVSYTMTEYSDIRFPLYHNYGWKKWLKDFKMVDDFAFLHWKDPIPMIIRYIKVFMCIVFRKDW